MIGLGVGLNLKMLILLKENIGFKREREREKERKRCSGYPCLQQGTHRPEPRDTAREEALNEIAPSYCASRGSQQDAHKDGHPV